MSDDNVTIMPGVTRLDIPVQRVVDGAAEADLESAVVIGVEDDGELYLATSRASTAETLMLIERAKSVIMRLAEGKD